VDRNRFLYTGFYTGAFKDVLGGSDTKMGTGTGAREKPGELPGAEFKFTKVLFDPAGKHYETIFAAFRGTDVQNTSGKIDIGRFKGHYFTYPETRGVGNHQKQTVFQIRLKVQ
jgi:hypothetical protein